MAQVSAGSRLQTGSRTCSHLKLQGHFLEKNHDYNQDNVCDEQVKQHNTAAGLFFFFIFKQSQII